MNSQEKFIDNKLFKEWVNSDDQEVEEYWKNWMLQHPEDTEELLKSRAFFRSIRFSKNEVTEDQIDNSWKSVEKGIQPSPVIWKEYFKYAAILTFFLISFFAVKYVIKNSTQEIKLSQVKSIYKHAEKGIKLTVQLSDGTKIKLNSGSQLKYPEIFADNLREVELIGEGYFEVTHDEKRPFVVKTGDINTKVLGTNFSIRAFDEKDIQVALVSGSVAVESNHVSNRESECASLLLEPGEKATYMDECFSRGTLSELYDLGWKDDIIAFRDKDITEIISILENWYGVTIVAENEQLISRSFNGIYVNEVLANVLHSIAHAMDFTYRIEGKKVYIKGQ